MCPFIFSSMKWDIINEGMVFIIAMCLFIVIYFGDHVSDVLVKFQWLSFT